MSEVNVGSKTYTCGWCKSRNLIKMASGDLEAHSKPGTRQAWCKGYQTYNETGRAK